MRFPCHWHSQGHWCCFNAAKAARIDVSFEEVRECKEIFLLHHTAMNDVVEGSAVEKGLLSSNC